MKTIVVIVALFAAVVSVTSLKAGLENNLQNCLNRADVTKEILKQICKEGPPYALHEKLKYMKIYACILDAAKIVMERPTDSTSQVVDVFPANVVNLVPRQHVARVKLLVEQKEPELIVWFHPVWASAVLMDYWAMNYDKNVICDSLFEIHDETPEPDARVGYSAAAA